MGFLPYLNTLWNGLVYDDQYQIVENPFLRSFHFLGPIFTTSVWSFQVKHATVTYYRPLMSLSYLLIYQLVGPVPYAFHLASVLLHCSVVILLFFVTRRVFESELLAWISVLWFALHPIHTEVVAWVAAVPDIQMTFFLLLAFWFYLQLEGATRRRWWAAASCACFALALLSKEPAVVFPGIVFAYDLMRYFGPNPRPFPAYLRDQSPLWVLSGIYLYFRFFVLSGIVANSVRTNMTTREIVLSAVSLFGSYMQKVVWPGTAGAAYKFRTTMSASDPRFVAGAACLCALGVALYFLLRRRSMAAFAIAWLAFPLLPVLDAKVMASNVFAERYLYLPSIGFCWLAAGLVQHLWGKASVLKWRIFRPVLSSTAAVACLVATSDVISRNAVWHDGPRLFAAMLKQDPANATAHSDLGAMYWNTFRRKDAISEWSKALSEDPSNFFALDNLGIAALTEKRYAEAIDYFRRAVDVRPGFPKAHAHLADALAGLGDSPAAEREYLKAIDLAPFDIETHNAYAKFCASQGRVQEATEQYRLSLSVAPTSEALDALGRIALDSTQLNGADKLFQEAVDIDPFDSAAHFGLAESLAKMGKSNDAIRHYERGLETDPKNEAALDAVAKLRAALH
ncbi:MAG TPA: tetratricopeptide repeat protein [Candidatus Acidoferrales bacterium]|nr:tetratricopeptide repeat protein [Candidatus Acidoferrales bacterium]